MNFHAVVVFGIDSQLYSCAPSKLFQYIVITSTRLFGALKKISASDLFSDQVFSLKRLPDIFGNFSEKIRHKPPRISGTILSLLTF